MKYVGNKKKLIELGFEKKSDYRYKYKEYDEVLEYTTIIEMVDCEKENNMEVYIGNDYYDGDYIGVMPDKILELMPYLEKEGK